MAEVKKKIKWFCDNLIMSYNTIIMFVVGARSNGKSFRLKVRVINNFLKRGEQFILLRRRRVEIDETVKTFFDDIVKEGYFEGHTFDVVANRMYIDGELAGYGLSILGSAKLKSVPYPKVTHIIFEEFMVSLAEQRNGQGYLKDEIELFLKFYITVNRGRGTGISTEPPVRVTFISNAESEVNPYFEHYGIKQPKEPKDDKVYVFNSENGRVAVQFFKGEQIQDAMKNSEVGNLIKNTEYGRHSLDNEFYQDSDDFIVKTMPSGLTPLFNLRVDKQNIGFWWDKSNREIYMSPKIQHTAPMYAVDQYSHTNNTMLFDKYGLNQLENVKKAFRNGKLYFTNLSLKTLFLSSIY